LGDFIQVKGYLPLEPLEEKTSYRYNMKIKHDDAVSEVIGAILLLAIAVATVSVVYTQVLSDPGPSPETEVTIVGKLENGYPVFSHQRGEELGLDTKIILTIAGYQQYIFTPVESLEGSNLNDEWNIGERLAFPDVPLEGLQVEGTVIDKLSNSIVFWGILQEGEIIRGKGGIWHLDDTDTLSIALDSSGYDNHGSVHDAEWIANGGRHGSALKFDGLNDYVRVLSTYGLYDSNTISVEAWMKSEPIDTILSNRNFNVKFGYCPDIVHVYGDIYAIAAEGKQQVGAHQGVLIALNITPDGNVSYEDIYNDSYIFDSDCGYNPDIINISGNIFAIAYQGPPNEQQGDGFLKTVEILPNGTINQTVIDVFEFDPQEAHTPKIIQVHDSIYAIAYRGGTNNGLLRTVEILPNGTINQSYINGYISELEFDQNLCYTPEIISINKTIFAIAYQGPPNEQGGDGFLKTVEILPNGTINQTVIDVFEFDPQEAHTPKIIHVNNSIYGIVYRGIDDNGFLMTLEILNNGTINQTIDTWQFNTADTVHQPDVMHFINNTFAITYSNGTQGNPPGALIRIDIMPNGTINVSTAQVLVEPIGVEPQHVCYESCLIKISDQIIAVAYREQGQGQGHPGYILTAGILSDDIPPYLRGVFKTESYGIFANLTTAVALINDQVITAELTPNEWHHVAMTYNRTRGIMKLYITKDQDATIEYSQQLNEPIDWNDNDIIFGKLFCGYIDEIGIFAKELSREEIQSHMYSPSSMELSLG